MTGVREVIRRFGMPDAISWPGFWATFLSALVGTFVTNVGNVSLLVRVGIMLCGTVAMWALLACVRFVFLRDADRSRPGIMLVAFIAGVLARASIVGSLYGLTLGPAEAKFGIRFVAAFLNTGLAFVLTASIVGDYRERIAQIRMLESQRRLTDSAIAQVATGMGEHNEQAIESVRSVLVRELSALEGASAAESLARLQATASDVVRPISHELANAIPLTEPQVDIARSDKVPWSMIIDSAASRRPFSPWVIAALFGIQVFGAALFYPQGWVVFAGLTVLLVGLLLGANRVLMAVLPGKSRGSRIALIVAAAVWIGCVIGGLEILILGNAPVALAMGGAVAFYAAFFSLGTALVRALRQDRDRVIRELQESARDLEHSLVRLRQAQWFQQKALSRALHGPVQMAVTAAAIQLDTAIREEVVEPGLIDQVRTSLLRSLDVLSNVDGGVAQFDDAVSRMSAVWEGICEITSSADNGAIRAMNAEVALRSCVIDIVTEAVSNAVRHGKATRVRIELKSASAVESELIIRVHNDGAGSGDSEGRGLGSRQLDECTVNWSREVEPDGQELIAVLPLG